MGAAIVSGLRGQDREHEQPGAGPATAEQADEESVAARLAARVSAVRAWLDHRLNSLATRAAARSITSGSLAAISLLLGLCSAAWFSGGQGKYATRGAIAVAGWCLAVGGARRLARLPRSQGTAAQRARPAGWPAAVCAMASEAAIYGGIAAGASSARGHALWPLAIATVSSVGVTQMIAACRRPVPRDGSAGRRARFPDAASRPAEGVSHPDDGGKGAGGSGRRRAGTSGSAAIPGDWPGLTEVLRRTLDWLAAPPAPARVLLALAGLAIGGPRAALLTVLAAEMASACCIVGVLARVAGPERAGRFARPAPLSALRAYRDDGPFARWTGLLVRGNLIPLPPALAGVIATALLAGLGLRGLPGFIVLTPPVVMLLAAPGSGHPHDGALDWLVPALIALGQYIYLGAFGLAEKVPGPIVFAACAITVIWYASLTAGSDGVAPSGIGWEARMLVPGVGAILGLATFGYVALAAYVGALICHQAVTGYLLPREEDST
jgi:hypothetical protein